MSYPKKSLTNDLSTNKQESTRLSEGRKARLLAIQQREQLKGMIFNKFQQKYGVKNSRFIEEQINEFMKNNKITEQNLKNLENKIKSHVQGTSYEDDVQKRTPQREVLPQLTSENLNNLDKQSVKSQRSQRTNDNLSYASSQAPKSVYQLGDADDEWAMITKFDQELFKKERELEVQRSHNQKKKIKNELDRQINDKDQCKQGDKEEIKQYVELQNLQLEAYDKREQEKLAERKRKVMLEKEQRDKQLRDEAKRRREEKKKDKELDDILVHRIQEEIQKEQKLIANRRKEELDHLKKVLIENEHNKKILAEEAEKERLEDVKAQQEYIRLLELQEANRAAELKKREDKARAFMSIMSDTVVKDQKALMLEEERKMLKHFQLREQRELNEENRKKQAQNDAKKDMKNYLDKQTKEKLIKKEQEKELEKKQAEFWQRDTQEYYSNEQKKQNYIHEVNLKHQNILKQQMDVKNKKEKRVRGKMDTNELLQNKAILKDLAAKNLVGGEGSVNFKKDYVAV